MRRKSTIYAIRLLAVLALPFLAAACDTGGGQQQDFVETPPAGETMGDTVSGGY
ncbi:MAG TPA: hypothetical protein VF212_01040 [Longimicrobiales bacterium]